MKTLALIFGIVVSVIAVFISLTISPSISNILFSGIFDQAFSNLPFYLYSLIIFTSGILYFLIFFYFSKIFLNANN